MREGENGLRKLIVGKQLIVVDGYGFEGVNVPPEADRDGPADDVLEKLVKAVPSCSPSAALHAGSVAQDSTKGMAKLFKNPISESLAAFCEDRGKSFSVLRCGSLTGGSLVPPLCLTQVSSRGNRCCAPPRTSSGLW